MRSFIAALRTLVLPFGQSSGQRIVIDGVNGDIILYDSANRPRVILATNLFPFGGGTYPGIALTTETQATDQFAGQFAALNATIGPDHAPYVYLQSPDAATGRGAASIVIAGGNTDAVNRPAIHLGFQDTVLAPYLVCGQYTVVAQNISYGTSNGVGTDPTLETWHNLPLPAGYSVVGGGYDQPGYMRTADGRVVFRGACNVGASNAAGNKFTLPVGYRPGAVRGCTAAYSNGTAVTGHMRYDVSTAGSVTSMVVSPAATQIFLFDQMYFYV